jgi:hypothetical protein
LAKIDLHAYALRGAQARLAELNDEIRAIHQAFPVLKGGRTGRHADDDQPVASPKRRRARPKMSAAQKKSVSERMKKYWAERRKSGAKK